MACVAGGGICSVEGHEPACVSYICTSNGCYKMSCGICRTEKVCCANPTLSLVPDLIKSMTACHSEGCFVYCNQNDMASHFHKHHEIKFPILSSQFVFSPEEINMRGYKDLFLPHADRVASYFAASAGHGTTKMKTVLIDVPDGDDSTEKIKNAITEFPFSPDQIVVVLAREVGLVFCARPVIDDTDYGSRSFSRAQRNNNFSLGSTNTSAPHMGDQTIYHVKFCVSLLYSQLFPTRSVLEHDISPWPYLVQCSVSCLYGMNKTKETLSSKTIRTFAETGTIHNCIVISPLSPTELPKSLSWQNPFAQSIILPIYHQFKVSLKLRGVNMLVPSSSLTPVSQSCSWLSTQNYLPNPERIWRPEPHECSDLFKLTMLTAIMIIDVYQDQTTVYELRARFQYPITASTNVDIDVPGRCVMCKRRFDSAKLWLRTCLIPFLKSETRPSSLFSGNACPVPKTKKRRRCDVNAHSSSSSSSSSCIRVLHTSTRTDGIFPKLIYTQYL